MEYILLIILGLIGGTFGGLLGLGGGIIIVPLLLYIDSIGLLTYPLSHENAVGISLLVIVITAFSSTLYNFKLKKIDIKSGLIFFISNGPAAIIGAIVGGYITEESFYLLFGLLILFMTFLLFIKDKVRPIKFKWNVVRNYVDENGNEHKYGFNVIASMIISGIAGLLAGMFGIGGGAFLVPMMIILFNFPTKVAVATSMFIILLSASASSISHILMGNIIYIYVLFIGIGAYTGGKLGSYLSEIINSKNLISLFRLVLLIIAAQMIYKGL